MRILIAEDEDDIRSVLAQLLRRYCAAEVSQARSGNEAIRILKAGPRFDCVISDYVMEDGSGGDLYRAMRKEGIDTPFILCSTGSPDSYPEFQDAPPAGHMVKPYVFRDLVKVVEGFRGSIEQVVELDALHVFFPVRVEVLARLGRLPCPVFIRLSETKFLKVMNAGEAFGLDDVRRFKAEKKLDTLHIRSEEAPGFLDELMKTAMDPREMAASDLSTPEAVQRVAALVKDEEIREALESISMMMKLTALRTFDAGAATDFTVSVHEKVRGKVKDLGFNHEVQVLASSSVNLAIRTLGHLDGFKDVMARLRIEPDSYLSGHSIHLAYFASSIASLLSWSSEITRFKLSLAAFLHDIVLETDDQARVKTLGDLQRARGKYGKEETRLVQNHPAMAVELLKQAEDVLSYQVDQVILSHHERPDGSGFPLGLRGSRIAPLAAVFIVAHDLVDFLAEEGRPAGRDLQRFLDAYESEYSVGHFKRIHEALRELARG